MATGQQRAGAGGSAIDWNPVLPQESPDDAVPDLGPLPAVGWVDVARPGSPDSAPGRGLVGAARVDQGRTCTQFVTDVDQGISDWARMPSS